MILLLSDNDIQDLVSIGCLQPYEEKRIARDGASYANFNRAQMWMSKRDVGFISAWRKEDENGIKYTREAKDKRNEALIKALKEFGYGVTKSRGFYPEGGGVLTPENSFFVVNLLDPREEFIRNMCDLSESFDQDSVLIKCSDSDRAFWYATNEYTRNSSEYPNGKKDAGQLHIGVTDEGGYSEIGSGKFCFKNG